VRDEPVVVGELAVFAVARVHPTGEVDWREVGAMVARLHELDPTELHGRYPTPWCGSFPWWDFGPLLDDVGPMLDPAARAGIDRALDRHGGWQQLVTDRVLCHGDVHPGNVLAGPDGPVLLDWDLVSIGPPAWDHAPLMTWTERWGGEPGIYEAFAAGAGGSLRGDPVAEALAELRLLAATLMRVRAGRTDPAAAAEAERRLRYWRGDPDAPTWTAA
jgi:Ser/Thr protein kinase RdoA (MazF antagonist)